MPEPGAPHSPVLSPRSKPEGRARAANDWFRHDVKENSQAPVSRLQTKQATEIAQKAKSESEDWYHHNGQAKNGTTNGANGATPPHARLRTNEAIQNQHKIKGDEEKWYKFDDNKDYVEARPASRLTQKGAQRYKDAQVAESQEWYKHEHGPKENYTPTKSKTRSLTPKAAANSHKLRPTGLPQWASHKDHTDGGASDDVSRPMSRLTMQGEEYLERNRQGNDWFTHDHQAEAFQSPRLLSPEGSKNAAKWHGESDNWFNHDANKNFVSPVKGPRVSSAAGRKLMEHNRGTINDVMNHTANQGYETNRGEPRVKPEAEAYAKKSVSGMMNKYLDQEGNKGYNSARPEARVKPEAQGNADRSKGVMNDCMDGYPDPPGSARKRHPRVKAEAEQYAERNKGTFSLHQNGTANGGLEITGRPIQRLKSPEAETIAARQNSSSVGNLIYNQTSVRQ